MVGSFDENCHLGADWPSWACTLGNASGYFSAVLWLVVLVPQVIHNERRQSTEGLSFAWAAANCLAAIVNVFFAFRAGLPLFALFSASYMPLLEFLILCQFWRFDTSSVDQKRAAAVGMLVVVAGVCVLELLLGDEAQLQWVAVALWSIEMLPQILLNAQRASTSGQADTTIGLSVVGKVTDSLSALLLAMPNQTVVLCFFSGTLAWVDCAQLAWYRWGAARHRLSGEWNLLDGDGDDDCDAEAATNATQGGNNNPARISAVANTGALLLKPLPPKEVEPQRRGLAFSIIGGMAFLWAALAIAVIARIDEIWAVALPALEVVILAAIAVHVHSSRCRFE